MIHLIKIAKKFLKECCKVGKGGGQTGYLLYAFLSSRKNLQALFYRGTQLIPSKHSVSVCVHNNCKNDDLYQLLVGTSLYLPLLIT